MTPVTRARVIREEHPLHLELGAGYDPLESLGFVVVGLVDGDGTPGVGWTFSIDPRETRQIERAARQCSAVAVGLDPEAAAENWSRLRAAAAGLARGVGAPVVSAYDVALWDLRARQRGVPVHTLLGGRTQRLRAYASDDLWSSLPPDALAANAARWAGQGFGALKIRTGGDTDPARELERVAAVTAACPEQTLILYDALQMYSAEEAIELGHALETARVGWLEDPVPETDLAGLARVTRSVDIRVAAGEDATWPEAHQALLGQRAVDVLMVDVKWVGGLTPWLSVARAAAERGVAMVSHISPELSAPVLSAHAPDSLLEWFGWSFGLYDEPPAVASGCYTLPSGPGFDLRYRADLLERLFA